MSSVEHVTARYANNRAEVSHQPTRQRERRCGGSSQRDRLTFSWPCRVWSSTSSDLDGTAYEHQTIGAFAPDPRRSGRKPPHPEQLPVPARHAPSSEFGSVKLTVPSSQQETRRRGAERMTRFLSVSRQT